MATKSRDILSKVWDYVVLTFGTLLYCMAWDSFLIPNKIASGGLTGLCTIIEFATGGAVQVPYTFLPINMLLLVLGFLMIGNAFGIKTIYCILVSEVFFYVLPQFEWLTALPGNFLYVDNLLLIAIIGGLLEAVGVGLIFQKGGSTGGTDVVAMILNKFYPVSPGKVYMVSDVFIIASVLMIPGKSFEDMIFGYIAMLTFSLMVDFVLLGSKSSVQILVFSNKYQDIADYIISQMDRGVTALNAVGWFTKAERKVLLILARKNQLHDITDAIKHIDNKAFVSVSPANAVYGEGFEEIKTGIKINKNKKSIDGAD